MKKKNFFQGSARMISLFAIFIFSHASFGQTQSSSLIFSV